MSEKDIDNAVAAIFEMYDKDKNGWLDESQLKAIMVDVFAKMGSKRAITDQEIKIVLNKMDRNKDGKIEPSELKELMRRTMTDHK